MVSAATIIPATMAADLPASSNDWPSRVFPSLGPVGTDHCVAATSCVFGDSRSRQTIVLFGDSHAVMWLPAIEPAAARRHWRLIVLWQPTCPVARISHFTYVDSVPNRQCAGHRGAAPESGCAVGAHGRRRAHVIGPSLHPFSVAKRPRSFDSRPPGAGPSGGGH